VVDAAVHSRDGAPYDYQKQVITFTVTARTGGVGVYFPEHRWEFEGGVRWEEETEALRHPERSEGSGGWADPLPDSSLRSE
jgi:hypothetical protein